MARYHTPRLLAEARKRGVLENFNASFNSEDKWDGIVASEMIPDR